MAKDDYITVRTKADVTLEVSADKSGRKVESEITKDGGINWFVARLLTRGGTLLEEIWVPTTEIVGIQRHLKDVKDGGS